MAAEGGNIIVRYVYRGEVGERIPREATHVFVDAAFIPAQAFASHPNIIEIICHMDVEKIEECAFNYCPSLRRVIMPGVKIVEEEAFNECIALTHVECRKLEIIGGCAFSECEPLRSINLPSARIVEEGAFWECRALTDVKFGGKLERIDERAFLDCPSLERITIPLKDGITADNTFKFCDNLKQVDLVEGDDLHETIAALNLEEWRNEMKREIDSINQILPGARAGYFDSYVDDDGEKARKIRRWIKSVLDKMIRYQEEHVHVLKEAATTLQFVLPQDLAMNNILPYLALPSCADLSGELRRRKRKRRHRRTNSGMLNQ